MPIQGPFPGPFLLRNPSEKKQNGAGQTAAQRRPGRPGRTPERTDSARPGARAPELLLPLLQSLHSGAAERGPLPDRSGEQPYAGILPRPRQRFRL